MEFAIIVVAALAVGAAVAWLMLNHFRTATANAASQQAAQREQSLEARLAEKTEEADVAREDARRAGEGKAGLAATNIQLLARADELQRERDQARSEARTAERVAADINTKLEAELARIVEERKSFDQMKKQLREDGEALTKTFEAIAGKIFDDKSATFRKLSTEQIDLLLKPLQQHLGELKAGVVDASKERGLLLEEIKRMAMSADSLTQSLRGDSKVQGDWGEMTLEAILDNAGLVKDESYTVQKEFDDDEGKTQKPDVVLWMPENRQMIVDSKVSLTDYDRFMNEADLDKRGASLNAHVLSVRKHIKELAGKKYDRIPKLNALDGVFMWVPIEGALLAAMQADKAMMADAVKQKIYPVGPTMFRACITIVERLWRFEKQNNSVKQIFIRAAQLYDKVRLFTESMDAVGHSLEAARSQYSDARSRLLTGQGNVAWQLQQLADLGVTPKKKVEGDWAALDNDVAEQVLPISDQGKMS